MDCPPRDFTLLLETGVPDPDGRGRFLARLLSPARSLLGESVRFDSPFDSCCLDCGWRDLEHEVVRPASVGSLWGRQKPRDLGSALFDRLFTADVGQRFRAARRQGQAVRIGLLIDPDEPGGRELCALPWELLYEDGRRTFLATSPDTPVVRHLWTTESRCDPTPDLVERCPVFYDPRRPRRRPSGGLDPDSERAIAAVQAGAPAAIAFQFPVSEAAFAAFGHALTQAQRQGRPIDEAITRGRQAMESLRPESWQWAAPVLYVADERQS